MQCPRCQQQAPADADFRPECGANLAAVCLGCGIANALTYQVCKKRGHGLARVPAAVSSVRRSLAFLLHTEAPAERILTLRAPLEGERKRVEELADPGSILLTSEMLAAREGYMQVVLVAPVAVKDSPHRLRYMNSLAWAACGLASAQPAAGRSADAQRATAGQDRFTGPVRLNLLRAR